MEQPSQKNLRERERRGSVTTVLERIKQLLVTSSLLDPRDAANMDRVDLVNSIVNLVGEVKEQERLAGMPVIIPDKFGAGLTQAKNEVSDVLSSMPNVDEELRQRLMAHLGTNIEDQRQHYNNGDRANYSRNEIVDEVSSPNNTSDEEIDVEN